MIMKKIFYTTCLILAAAAMMSTSCKKEDRTVPSGSEIAAADGEIRFVSDGLDMNVSTRTTAIDAVSGLTSVNVHCFTGTGGSSETNVWTVTGLSAASGTISTGKYWPASNPSYRFVASNAAITPATAGATISPANCDTDWVVAKNLSPTFGSSNALAFSHILARVGTVTLNTQSGYELSSVSATLKSACHSGVYKLATDTWTSKAGASDNACASFSGSTSAQASSNDIYVVPGTYTLSITYTLTKGAWTGTFTKSGSVTLVAGKINAITATAIGGAANEITFTVTITPWGSTTLNPTLS